MSFTIQDAVASPFARLRQLLIGIEPGKDPIDLSLGEPRHPMPEGIGTILQDNLADFGRYPPIIGTPKLRTAISNWHKRRYPSLSTVMDPDQHIIPLNGSREGLFSALFPALDRRQELSRPVILIPNPFYQCYAAAALAAKAEPVFLDAPAQNGFLPNLDAIDANLLTRTAVLYLCSPSNPQGAVADKAYLKKAITLARQYNFVVFSDECYSEIYGQTPPPGILETAFNEFGNFDNVVAFNSLSKRSNLPGLRSGFIAGDPEFLARYAKFRNVACPQMPLPVQQVSAEIWTEESHVEKNRDLYSRKLDAADEILKDKFNYKRPEGGFFLWLDMSEKNGGEAAVKTLWKGYGVKLLPGAYLAMAGSTHENPGKPYVRLALVDTLERTEKALKRLIDM